MGKKISRIEKSELSIKTLLAMTIADVDIFLLQNEEQTEDLNKTFSVEEIRNQLSNTLKKVGGLIAGAFAFSKIIDMGREIFDQTKKLDALSAGFRTVITDSKKLEQTYAALDSMSQKYGININNLKQQ